MLTRPQDWPERLALFLREKDAQPFDWRANNCAFFACDWIACLLGIDPAASYRAKVDGPLSAIRAVEEAGGIESIANDACARWEWPVQPVALARRGDVMLYDFPTGAALGLCIGARSVFVGKEGFVFVRTMECRTSWRVG